MKSNMQTKYVRLIAVVLSCLLASTLFAQAANPEIQVKSAGTLAVGSVQIPAYVVAVENSIEDGMLTPELSKQDMTVQKSISPEAANSLAAYWTNVGWLLAPRGWKVARAAVGADNSSVYEFSEPDGGAGRVTAYDSGGACVGCAVGAAALYFPDARRELKEIFGSSAPDRMEQVPVVKLGKHTVAYTRHDSNGQVIDGIAYYNADGGDFEAFTCEVSLPQSQHALATAILNWRLPPKSER
jgi:hypothetical protein